MQALVPPNLVRQGKPSGTHADTDSQTDMIIAILLQRFAAQ